MGETTASAVYGQMANNFRDVAMTVRGIKHGVMFRSGNVLRRPDVLTKPDGRITRILDLRGASEYESNEAWLAAAGGAVTIRTFSSAYGSFGEEQVGPRRGGGERVVADVHQNLVIHRVSLLDKKKFVWRLLWKLPLLKMMKLIGNDAGLRDVLVPVVNDLGLELVYTTILETSKAEIAACLGVLLECLRDGRALLVMCELGKDRTGLLVSLVLGCCQVSTELILDDYELSNGVGKVALAGVDQLESLRGLNREMFAEAPRVAMMAAFTYLDENYGSCQAYLAEIGFDPQLQSEMRRRMTS